MKPKMMIKLAIDIAMTVIMLLLMTYVFTGYRPHMWTYGSHTNHFL